MAKSQTRVEALTGARALAGLYILLLHFGAPLFARAPGWMRTLRGQGYVATSFFLMLSGFMLTVVYGARLADGSIDRRRFLLQRVARVYPGYALGFVLLIPFAVVHRWGEVTAAFGDASLAYKLVSAVGQLTMSHVWLPQLATSWNLPGWCVSVELWFYLALPFAATWLLRLRGGTIVAVLVGAWVVALAFSTVYTVVQPDGFHAEVESYGFWLSLFKFTPYTRWPEFLFGVALGALWLRLPAERRGRRWATPLVAGGALAALAILLAGARIPYALLHNGGLLPLYAAIVWGLMLGGDGPLHRALALPPLTTLGDASYVLYVLQVPVMQWLVLIGGRRYGSADVDAPFTALALGVIVAVAIAVRQLFERPAQAWLKARLVRLRARGPSTPLVPTPVVKSASA